MTGRVLIFQNISAGFGTGLGGWRLEIGSWRGMPSNLPTSDIQHPDWLPRLHRAGPSASLDELRYSIVFNVDGVCLAWEKL